MSETEPRTATREEFNRELVQALDDLVSTARHHGELIKAAFNEPAKPPVAREMSPPYGEIPERLDRVEGRLDGVEGRLAGIDQRLDRIERTLTDIHEQMATKADLDEVRRTMATKIELEAMSDKIKMVADGYQTVGQRLDQVADLVKLRVVMP